MRFDNNLLLASFLGVATAFRRSCRPDTTSHGTDTGFYSITNTDTLTNIAADFCTTISELQNLNNNAPTTTGDILKVPCKARKRDCSRIPGSDYGYYTIVEGDDLATIGADFCTDANGLAIINDNLIAPPPLSPGMVLEVPCSWN
ncbi:putative Ecp7(P20) [Drepanopeziza brunnea f. sp. 'multigermtubi' MB_m1]|uniref:LysM16p n=2 Tax=Drepanopeziza brunnea f. sp. 'multigermtubi' TaxID=698441 RepID=J9XN78_9HELO|nr:putative Ecp7(P20) [Drepanopeziza brunnea f. sp. 'multigermtubi' MB_m1]AFS30734.1 LysM16p [Drepanopeziza brunnea f. sp. 'multigermtubi']EKD18824.1 putative Ecp7(P20) [Drepanopeziza brunnea f. sp. 'multigermtubi' MB_m1]